MVKKTSVTKTYDELEIKIPTSDANPNEYMSRFVRVDSKSLSLAQRLGFKRVFNGLRAANATLANGKPVKDNSDVVRWLFEQIK